MKIKALIFASLLVATASCKKEEPLNISWEEAISSFPGLGQTNMRTPKGYVPCQLVSKLELPAWLETLTESFATGYVMKAGADDQALYFVYDTQANYGRHYDAQGHPAKDNPALADWKVIYLFYPPTTPTNPIKMAG